MGVVSRSKQLVTFIFTLSCTLTIGCADSDLVDCRPDERQTCECSEEGSIGLQWCEESGDAWTECDCDVECITREDCKRYEYCDKNGECIIIGGDTDTDIDTDMDVDPDCQPGGTAEGDFDVHSAASLESLSDCAEITGDLHVVSTGLTDLAGLESLERVGGDMFIEFNSSLVSLNGLQGLESVRSLSIAENHVLESFDGLSRLATVGIETHLFANLKVASLEGLASLVNPGNRLTIYEHRELSSCDADRFVERLRDGGWDGEAHVSDLEEGAPCRCPERILEGDAVIVSAADLAALDGTTAITGSLTISAPALFDLHGLECLTAVGGTLRLEGNAALTDLSGLRSLSPPGGDVEIVNNGALRSLQGMQQITELIGGLRIEGNAALPDFGGLESLSAIGGDLAIIDNGSATRMRGLHRLVSIGGSLRLEGNSSLGSLLWLLHLEDLGGDLGITGNPVLPGCEADELRDHLVASGWTGSATIENNDQEATCDCPGGLIYPGEFTIADAASLASLTGYRAVDGRLKVRSPTLTDLKGLECLESIEDGLTIEDSPELTSLDGLEALRRTTYIGLRQNEKLSSIRALAGLTDVSGFVVRGCLELASLDGLQGLSRVPGAVSIGQTGVSDLTDLSNLVSVGGYLEIGDGWCETQACYSRGNPNLESLSGLENLETVGADLRIHFNDQLTDITSLGGVSTFGGNLEVNRNLQLPTCAAEELRDRLIAGGWSGEATIEGNDDSGTCE